MSGAAYAIGVDFGTESGRAVLIDAATGAELSSGAVRYPHGVIDYELPGTTERLPPDWALQDPDDWLLVLADAIPYVVAEAGIDAQKILGIGVDFTSCTVLPVDSEGIPLCKYPHWRRRRHAWPKLWKHHAAQPVADRLTEVAHDRNEDFISRYGGRISSEWYFPKLIELWLEDRELYHEAHAFVEATDWVVWHLTGRPCRQTCTAGYKAMWSPYTGLPRTDYFEAAYPGFDVPAAKLGTKFVPLGTRAGTLRAEVAEDIGLPPTTAVAVGNVDSFVSVPGAGVDRSGVYVTVMGTSTCDMVVHPEEIRLPGITGVVRDGILPGLYGYEAGQPAVGDMLGWFVETFVDGPRTFADLEEQAAKIAPGETGLVALPWWNGNRSILADADLTGVLFGLQLGSTAVDVYRALLESIAFATKRIMDNFEEHGLNLEEIVAVGGIPARSPLLMQLLADTTGREVHVPDSTEIPARGSALFGSLAAGVHQDINQAIAATKPATARTYTPDPGATQRYAEVYAVFRDVYELLGRTQVELLHKLKRIRTSERSRG